MSMGITRLTELSIYFRLEELLSRRRVREKPKTSDSKIYTLKNNRVQTNLPVSVFVNDEEVLEGFKFNYRDGIVIFDNAIDPNSTVKVNYSYCPVNIYNEGENPLDKDFKYPGVTIYEEGSSGEPIEIGTNKKEKNSRMIVEVWTERGGERSDITDSIVELFEENIPIIDYSLGFPISRDGTKNKGFNTQEQTIGYIICDSINYNKGGSLDIGDKPKYLSEIYLDLIISR